MKTLTVKSKLALALTGGVMIFALTLASFGVPGVYADDSGPASKAFTFEFRPPEGWLEKAYQRELSGLEVQQIHLNWANKAATELQAWIDNLLLQGVDPSGLIAALRVFQAQIAIAQAAHDTAGSILSAHAGFDAQGVVIDIAQARQTVMTARQSLLEAHAVLKQAVEDLHESIRAFREAH